MSPRQVFIEDMWVETGYGSGAESAVVGVCGLTSAFEPPPWSLALGQKGHAPQVAQSGIADEHGLLMACLNGISRGAKLTDRTNIPVFFGLSAMAGTWMEGRSARQRAVAALDDWGGGTAETVHTNACVSSTYALIEAAAAVRSGQFSKVIAIGARKIERETYELFRAGGAMSRAGTIQPFGAERDGLLLGDGAAAVLLSGEQTAERQVELRGWALSGDGCGPVRPDPAGTGLATAIEQAIFMAQVPAGSIDTINAHGTGTPSNDSAESAAYNKVFGSALPNVHVASTKSSLGHALEATGLVEATLLVACLDRGVLPINRMDGQADPELAVSSTIATPANRDPEIGLSVNSAFGGANAVLLFGRASV